MFLAAHVLISISQAQLHPNDPLLRISVFCTSNSVTSTSTASFYWQHAISQAAPLLSWSQAQRSGVSDFLQNAGGQLFWWHLGCLHVELQQSSGKGLPLGIAIPPSTGLVSFSALIGRMLDFGLGLSEGQDYAYTVQQQHKSIVEPFQFPVSFRMSLSVMSCLTFWCWVFWSNGVCFYLTYILISFKTDCWQLTCFSQYQ